MEKETCIYNSNMDYEKIFKLYGINRSHLSQKQGRAYRKALSDRLDKYLERNGLTGTPWEELSEFRQNDFICFEIRKYMFKKLDDKQKKKAEENLENYTRNTLTEGANLLLKRNNSITDGFYKKDYVKDRDNTSDFIKEKSYKEFLQNWTEICGTNLNSPSFETFSEHPNFSVYDYIMTMSEPDDLEPAINRIVQSIVLRVLEEKFGLKIDYEKIRKCLQEQQALYSEDTGIDPSYFEFEKFPETFEEYWKNVIYGREDEYTEEDKKEIYKQYEKTREKIIRLLLIKQQLDSLTDFYEIK